MSVVLGCVRGFIWLMIPCRVENSQCFGIALKGKIFFTWSRTGHEVVGGGADAGRAPYGVVGGVRGGGGGVGEEGVRARERVREVGGGRGGRPLKLERRVVPENCHHHQSLSCTLSIMSIMSDGENNLYIVRLDQPEIGAERRRRGRGSNPWRNRRLRHLSNKWWWQKL